MLTFHSKGKKSKVRVTVTAVEQDNCVGFGVARCSENDQFLKAKGRELSLARAGKTPTLVISGTRLNNKGFLIIAKALAKVVRADARLINK